MADCDCMECERCEGHGWVYVGTPEGDEGLVPDDPSMYWEEECTDCDGTGIDPDYTGCDC